MSDEKTKSTEELSAKTVGELSVDELIGIFVAVLNERRTKGDPRLIDLSVKEFGEFMLDNLKTRAYQTAAAETDTAQRILTDWQALENIGAVAQPFRAKNVAEIDSFADGLRNFFRTGGRGELVIAVAIKSAEGGYSRPNGAF